MVQGSVGDDSAAMEEAVQSVFGRLEVRLDPWQPEFGPEFAGMEDIVLNDAQAAVDIGVERPSGDWGSIEPGPRDLERSVWFIDGVRRLEARVTAKVDGSYCYGAFGSYAVGSVHLNSEQAYFDRFVTGRIFALASAEQPSREIQVSRGLNYIPARVVESEPDAPLRTIHGQMRQAEEALAREIASHENRLVVVDGPLTFEESTRGCAVGYVKRIIKPYLGPLQIALLPLLKPGQRTPLFALSGSRRFARTSWFLRLTELRKGDSDFSGVVRLEVAASVGLEKARMLADSCGALLPSLKGRRALDRRAPQNLMPIGALETFLRRKLGDERMTRRRLESFLAREAR